MLTVPQEKRKKYFIFVKYSNTEFNLVVPQYVA